MGYVDRALDKISKIADSNGMEAYLTGVYKYTDKSDPRLLKIAPKGLRTRVLLEIDFQWRQMRIYRHRTQDLTDKHRGDSVSIGWIVGFIEANTKYAEHLATASTADHSEEVRLKVAAQKSQKPSAQELKHKRLLVECKCRGEVEKCNRCQGSGQYWTDGFGNIL